MKFVAVILVGCLLSSYAHDEYMAAAFGLIIGAAVLTAVVDDIEDDDRDHRRGYGTMGAARAGAMIAVTMSAGAAGADVASGERAPARILTLFKSISWGSDGEMRLRLCR